MTPVEERVNRVRQRLARRSLDGLLVSNLTNIRYLSGFTGSSATCLILSDQAYFISDGRYLSQSRQEVNGMEIVIGAEPHVQIIKNKGLLTDGLAVAFEADHVPVSMMESLKTLFSQCQWDPTARLVEEIAAVKDEQEIRLIRKAVELTDEVYDQIVPELRPGVREREIAAKISFITRMLGADGDAFSPIVGSGPNSALPHAVPGEREFKEGDFVVLDFGARYKGYHADMTRTVVIGPATERHKEIYDLVREAQDGACGSARAGVTCKQVDSAARDIIEQKGYGDRFVHGTGHGLGLEVHTLPKLSQLSGDTLHENYVVTIEPGVYVPDWGGVRIEDDVIVKTDGCEVLNQSTRNLLVLS